MIARQTAGVKKGQVALATSGGWLYNRNREIERREMMHPSSFIAAVAL